MSCDKKGERIAYASGKSIFLRSIDDPSSSKQYTGHTSTTTCARFSPSGFYIASGDVSGQVRVWDAVEAVNTKGEYSIIAGRINDIAWDGDSARIIAVGDGRDRFGHCITADSGNSVGEISGHSKVINAVSMRQQRPFRAATVSDDGAMCFLHGAPFKFAAKADGLHKGFVLGTAFSPDGSRLVTVGADKKIQLYDGKTGEATGTIGDGAHTGSIFAVSWAADSKRFVTASADQTVKVWDVEAGKCVKEWRIGEEGVVSVENQQVGVVWPHGRSDGLIISLGLNGDLHYLKEDSATPTKVVSGHNKTVTAMGAASDGKSLLTGSFDGRVCHWDVASGVGTVLDGSGHTSQVTQFATSATTTYSTGWDDTLRVIDANAATFAGIELPLSAQPKGVATGANEHVFVALTSGLAVYAKNELIGELKTDFTPTSIAAHGSTVAVGADANAVHIFKLDPSASSKLTFQEVLKNSNAQISSLAFSLDGAHLAAGNSAGKIHVYKTSSWELATDRWSAHTARVTCLAWNEAGTHAVSGALDTHVFAWSLAKPGSRVKALNAHKDGVTGVAWVAGGKQVASVGGDAAVKIWTPALQ